MHSSNCLKLAVICQDDTIRDRFLDNVSALRDSGKLASILPKNQDLEIQQFPSLESAAENLGREFDAVPGLRVLLVSDLLAEPAYGRLGMRYEPTSGARAIQDEFKNANYVSLAIVDQLKRVPEIDHVVSAGFSQNDLFEALALGFSKLEYLSPASRRELEYPVVIREIQREHEMFAYFQMRYHVYNIMGYLEEQCWNLPSRMEMDWCDTTAIHIGAFEMRGTRERLIGTSRIVNTQSSLSRSSGLTTAIASCDPILERELERSALSMRLPIFQSSQSTRMRKIFMDVETHELNCGEVSRIIIDKSYRGTGLANLLVKFCVFKANEEGIDPLLLECLDIHVPFYEKFGFRKIEGQSGRVVGVGKSMVAMELTMSTCETFLAGAGMFVDLGRMCACRNSQCFKEDYQFYGTEDCPLEHF